MGVSAGPVPALAAWSATPVGRAAGSASIPPFVELCWCTTPVSLRSRANMARTRQSRPDFGLGFDANVVRSFGAVPSSLGSSPSRNEWPQARSTGGHFPHSTPEHHRSLSQTLPGHNPCPEKIPCFTPLRFHHLPAIPTSLGASSWRLANKMQCIPCSVSVCLGSPM